MTPNHAIRIHQPGSPDVLKWEKIPVPEPASGEVLIQHKAVGVNYIDTYHRSGLYKIPAFPAILGLEGCGVVKKCGPGCEYFRVGDRVAYAGGPLGAYAQWRVIPEKFLVKVPEEISNEIAAAVMVKGLTAHYLLRRTFLVGKGVSILVHAAAGGVGLLLCQWAKHLGASVIGTVGSAEKAALAKQNGCDHPILYTKEDVAKRVREITGGKGVNVVYDSVGRDTFMNSLDCLMKCGLMVCYGQASGPILPFEVSLLARKGSLFLTRPNLFDYMEDQAEYIAAAASLFELVAKGILKVHVKQSYYLSDAVSAHRDLEARKTQGSIILLPAH